jgi:hypothetical protein
MEILILEMTKKILVPLLVETTYLIINIRM